MEPLKKPVQAYHMPQMTDIPFSFIKQNLDEMGVQCEPILVAISQLKPIQKEVDLNKVESLNKVEDDKLPPIFISSKAQICDGHHRVAKKKYSEGENAKIRAIRLDKDEKDSLAYLKVIQDRWERSQNN